MRSHRSLALALSMFTLAAFALIPGSAGAVTGAAFTTTNTAVDGTGHCKNGNPAINCNIYDGKEFVWLNGGPNVAYVGGGDYFFAVLDSGGQDDPNDGARENLSDDPDTYTNRTFSVASGTSPPTSEGTTSTTTRSGSCPTTTPPTRAASTSWRSARWTMGTR